MTALTPEELDLARAREVHDKEWPDSRFHSHGPIERSLLRVAKLAREGWTPTDPDLIEARALVVDDQQYRAAAIGWLNDVTAGRQDQTFAVRLALAAIKRGRELAREGDQ